MRSSLWASVSFRALVAAALWGPAAAILPIGDAYAANPAPPAKIQAPAKATTTATSNAHAVMLAPKFEAGQTNKVTAKLIVGGDLHLREAKTQRGVRVPMHVDATLVYDERITDCPTEGEGPINSLRSYRDAKAGIQVDKQGFVTTLRDDRKVIIAEQNGEKTMLAAAAGPLTRDELELIDVLASSLTLPSILPNKEVKPGDKWTLSDATMQNLLRLDALGTSDVEAMLADVKDGVAQIDFAGKVSGAALGVSTELDVQGRMAVVVRTSQPTGLILSVKEKRTVGHVAPGLDVTARLELKIEPISQSPALDQAVAMLPPIPPAVPGAEGSVDTPMPDLSLEVLAANRGFELICDRRWHETADEENLVVLRLVDRGDLIAQCNISPVTDRTPEKNPSLEQFQADVKHSLGKRFQNVIAGAEWTDANGQRVYRVAVAGTSDDLPIEWHYYLIAHPSGRRLALSTTVEGELVERLADADRALVDSIRLIPLETSKSDSPTEEAKKPVVKEASAPAKSAK